MSSRGAGIAGIASFVLIVVAALVAPLWGIPSTGSSEAAVAGYIAAHRDATLVALFLYALAFGLFFAFAAGAWARLRDGDRMLAATFAFAAVAMATMILAAFVPLSVAAYRAPAVSGARELRDATFGLLALSGVPTAAALAAYVAVVLRTRCLAVWSAWVAVVGVAAHVVIAASFLFRTGFFSLEGGVIVAVPATLFGWILLTSVALLRGAPRRA
jgi:hypothetical protein